MKIATYNVNSINARLPVLLRWLAASNPDIVCLQELKAPDEKFPVDATRAAGYEAIWHGQKSYNGIAILARDKPESWVDDALFLSETREAYRQLLDQGWTDSLRHLYPEEVIYTFWDYMRGAFSRNAGLRIDHLLLSPELAPRLKAAGVDREVRAMEKTSDHAPTWIELEVG